MKEIERIIQECLQSNTDLAQAIKSYIIKIVGEEKEHSWYCKEAMEMDRIVNKERECDCDAGTHNHLRTTILKRLEGES